MDDEMGKSKLVVYSMGTVAANKPTNSLIIEVTPLEDLPMISGQVTDNLDTSTAAGTDSQGVAYQTQGKTANTIKATWLGIGSPNQITAPDVRRGEMVVIYKYAEADADQGYFWVTYKQDLYLRRLETVVYAWSGQPSDGVKLTPDNMAENMYYIEVSTHQGHIMLHTSKANSEYTTHDVVLDSKNGRFTYEDGIGNQVLIDSANNRIYLNNADGSMIDLSKRTLVIDVPDSISINTKDYKVVSETSSLKATTNTLEATTNTVKATTTHTGNFTENGALALQGDMTAEPGGGSGGSGAGNITMRGNFRLFGSMTADGNITSLGTIHGNRVTWDS